MRKDTLALLGGTPTRTRPFPAYRVFGPEEQEAARRVIDSGVLSRFLGAWHEDFYGGPEVRAFEEQWASIVGVAHGISVNSCTSGLYAAVGAAGVGPGDEVIVSPYTMAASATAPMIFNAVPVFADIDPASYCLSAETIAARLTPRTKAILVVHIFGQSADMDPIMELATAHDLVVIEDCAQAPFATYKGRPVGSLGHMGVFSLNYHKHIHTGEGGMVTTADAGLAERLQLIRNHAEAVVERKGVGDLRNMVGFNFRLGEIEAAIGREQLRKGPALISRRRANVAYLERQLDGLAGLTMPATRDGSEHVYYAHTLDYDAGVTGVPRETLVKALKAELPPTELREREGPLIGMGYVKPLYLLPIFQQQIAYGGKGCPFACPHYEGKTEYARGLCPNVERAHFERVITHEMMRPGMAQQDLDDVAAAFHKVWANLPSLADTAHGVTS
jgi:dTDP-4-amino-4,6-dideoxygalactose transaminase